MKPETRIYPPVYLAGALIIMAIAHFALPAAQVLAFPLTLIGLLPIAVGIAFNLSADRAFKAHRTTVKPFERSRALVIDGVFSVTRNPMYLGMVLILVGVGLLLGSLLPFLVVVAFALLIDRRFVLAEERMLAETFGDDWQAYRRRVRRWL
jgi:protein-S-isoprenylcysteine O-methyltransferase Ste14